MPFATKTYGLRQTLASIGPIANISRTLAGQLCDFNSLDSFELSLHPFQLSDLPAKEVEEMFGDLDSFSTWKLYCGTLQRVTLFGTILQ